MGIIHQGILHHLGSKEQLFVEVLAYREHLDVQDFENHEPPHGPELLRHLVHTAVVNTGRIGLVQSYVVLSAESVTDGHPAQASFRDRFAVLRGLITEALATCVPPEHVQVYLARPDSAVERPVRWLAAHGWVEAAPGAGVTTVLDVPARAFEHWDTEVHGWVREPGAFRVEVGPCAGEILLDGEL